jgi:pimeloyl-ACP methyl ester carboxylesterase/predicted glycosyltransferase
MRARLPEHSGTVSRNDGTTTAYDVYNPAGTPTVLLLPAWQVANAELWKAQVPVLARRHRVITIDGLGTGRSDRPTISSAYADDKVVEDVVAVLDAEGVHRVIAAGVSCGGSLAAQLAAAHPRRVHGIVMIAPAIDISPPLPARVEYDFHGDHEHPEGWALYSARAWQTDYERFIEFFWQKICSEPHSTKLIEDGIGWARDTGNEVLIATAYRESACSLPEVMRALLRAITVPVLLIHGSDDAVIPLSRSEVAADLTGGDLLVIEGGGHVPQARDPIRVNRALAEFIERVTPAAERPPRRDTWTRALRRSKRVLFLSSPIGLGHARRDLAIAGALREECAGVQVDWLTQHPVTRLLEDAGEAVHPAARALVSESAHFENETHEHSLHAFQAVRRMDEILVANFSVLQELVDSGDYDLVIGDEAWDVDHFWHENPELKKTAFAWITDFVGWLPMPEGGTHEEELTADYNAEMLEHIERFARVRDRSIFVGELDDVIDESFGPGLPGIREWTARHYEFCGYITGFAPPAEDERRRLRTRLGHPPDQPLVIATVGGTSVGASLLRKVVAAYEYARKERDDLRLLVVAGPRIDPAVLPHVEGVDVRGYVPDLHLHLAACDAAVVQGGLTTTMELVAARRPFVYFPLDNHFEQQRHVRHRLERHRAGRPMRYADADPEAIADALLGALSASVDYAPVASDGAARAARLVAELL